MKLDFWGVVKYLSPIAILHIGNTLLTNLSMGAVDIKFTYTVKSGEPLTTALFFWLIFGQAIPRTHILALLPIPIGVAIASISDVSVTFAGFITAFLSVLISSARTVIFKKDSQDSQMSNLEQYLRLSSLSALWMLPLFLIQSHNIGTFEAHLFISDVNQHVLSFFNGSISEMNPRFIFLMLGAGYHFLYNLFSFQVLSMVFPLTHSLGNVMKRLLTIAYSMIYFGNALVPLNVIGIALSNFGVLLYVFEKNRTKIASSSSSKLMSPNTKFYIGGSVFVVLVVAVCLSSGNSVSPGK
jgi:solute carrier family 35 protein E1